MITGLASGDVLVKPFCEHQETVHLNAYTTPMAGIAL